MNGVILATKPYTNFPSGGMAFCAHASKILDANILVPSGHCIDEIGLMNISDRIISNFSLKPDYLLFGAGVEEQGYSLDIKNELGIPLVMMVHDIWYVHENVVFINISDGFIVSMDETADEIKKIRPEAKIIRLPLPYVFQDYEFTLDGRKNAIISTGRIVPEKGHRHPAQLAGLGYDVWVAGQYVDHDEYKLYYNKIERSGAKVFPNPTASELKELLKQAKIFMGFTYTIEQHCQPEYSLLEACNFGCLPIIAAWMEKYTAESGLMYEFVECAADAIPAINIMFGDDVLYAVAVKHNMEILRHWSDDYREKFENFVRSL